MSGDAVKRYAGFGHAVCIVSHRQRHIITLRWHAGKNMLGRFRQNIGGAISRPANHHTVTPAHLCYSLIGFFQTTIKNHREIATPFCQPSYPLIIKRWNGPIFFWTEAI